MPKLQEIFTRLRETKKQQKVIKSQYRDALTNNTEYSPIVEDLKKLREKKKQIEEGIKADMAEELNKLEDLKYDLATDMELLNDAALTTLMKGEKVEVTDEYEQPYEPKFKVTFTKIN